MMKSLNIREKRPERLVLDRAPFSPLDSKRCADKHHLGCRGASSRKENGKMAERMRVWVVAVIALALLGVSGAALAADPPNWVAVLYMEGQKAVGLRWTPVPGATAFKVLRSTAAGKDYKEIASPATPQYFDKDIQPGSAYYYVLQTVAGAETSAMSAEKSVVIPGEKKVEAAVAPAWDKVTLTESTEFGKTIFKVGVFWVKSTNPDVVAYNLYRTTASGKDYQLVSSIPDTKYVDATVEEGKTYYYVVSALDNQFKETPFSPEKSIAIIKTVKEEKKKAEKSQPIVPRGTKELFRLSVKNYPADIELLPSGELGVAASYVLIFPSTEENAEAADVSEGWTDCMGVGVGIEGDLLAVSASQGLRIYSPSGRVKKEYQIPRPELGTIVDFGEIKIKTRNPIWYDVAQAPDGKFYVTDNTNQYVVILDDNGKYLGIMNAGKPVGVIATPSRIRIYKDGNRYINSFGLSAYLIFNPKDELIRTVGELGGQVGTFGKIQGTAFDAAGLFYVGDMQNGNVQVFNPAGEYQFMLTDETEKANIHAALISGVAVAPDGKRIYVAESMSKTIAVLEVLPPKK
jgi:fibronectin type 3 domain-containing protein